MNFQGSESGEAPRERRICKVTWCASQAADGRDACVIHSKHPNFKPEDDKPRNLESPPCWQMGPCEVCEGAGNCWSECECAHCNAVVEDHRHECGACDGEGKVKQCSVCAYVPFGKDDCAKHEKTCWEAA